MLVQPVEAPGGGIEHIFGGRTAQGCSNAVYGYDVERNTLVVETPMPAARESMAAARGTDGLIYVIGGDDCNGHALNVATAYDESDNVWIPKAPLPTARTGLAAVAAPDGRLYAIGGRNDNGAVQSTVDIYDPDTDTWSSGPPLLTPRTNLRAAVGVDGKIYAVGGSDSNGADLCSVEMLAPGSDTWIPAPPLNVCRHDFGLAAASNNTLSAFGGISNGNAIASVESFDPRGSTTSWIVQQTALPNPLANAGVAEDIDGNVLLVDGIDGGGLSILEADPAPDAAPHTLTFYLHGTDEPGDYGGRRMDQQVPPTPQSGLLNLAGAQSWFSFPSLTGTFGSGAQAAVVLPCSPLSIGLLATYTLAASDDDDTTSTQLGQTSQILTACIGGQAAIPIPLAAQPLNHQIVELTISSLLGLNLAPGNVTLQLTNFTGNPWP